MSSDLAETAIESETPVTHKQPLKRRKRKMNRHAINQIKKYQKSTGLLVPKASFSRLVREIATDFKADVMFREKSLDVLQEESENFIVQVLQKAYINSIKNGRQTIMHRDFDTK